MLCQSVFTLVVENNNHEQQGWLIFSVLFNNSASWTFLEKFIGSQDLVQELWFVQIKYYMCEHALVFFINTFALQIHLLLFFKQIENSDRHILCSLRCSCQVSYVYALKGNQTFTSLNEVTIICIFVSETIISYFCDCVTRYLREIIKRLPVSETKA